MLSYGILHFTLAALRYGIRQQSSKTKHYIWNEKKITKIIYFKYLIIFQWTNKIPVINTLTYKKIPVFSLPIIFFFLKFLFTFHAPRTCIYLLYEYLVNLF